MREAKLLSAFAVFLLLVAPAGAAVWSENFESTALTAPLGSWTYSPPAAAWETTHQTSPSTMIGTWKTWAVRGDTWGTDLHEQHHITPEQDSANPLGSGMLGTDAASGFAGITGANQGQISIGNPLGNGNGPFAGVWKIITGLPINTPLSFDGFWPRRGGTGTANAWMEVNVVDDTSTLPTNGVDWGPAGMVTAWRKNRSASMNGGGQMSTTANITYNTFTTTDGTILLMLRSGVPGSNNGTWTVDYDDLIITPEPSAILLMVLGIPMFRRRSRRA